MGLRFVPDPGMVLICDYDTGFMPPEMTKKRRVVIISPKSLNNRGICSVVPLSTTQPDPILPVHVKFEPGAYRFVAQDTATWAKCDMLATVALKRLDRLYLDGYYISPKIAEHHLLAIREAASHAIGFAHQK